MGLIRLYRFIRFLSLDIVLGVAAGSLLVCRVLKLYAPLSYQFLLPLAVWTLYLTDHLIDGLRQANNIRANRYQHYYYKRRPLIALIIVQVILAIMVLIFSFDSITFQFGVLTGIVVLGYFIFQQLRFRGEIHGFPKEPVIAVVYTLGIWGVPLLMSKEIFGIDLYIALLSFALMVLMNVQLYSILQAKEDKESGYPSLAGTFGIGFVHGLNLACGIIVALLNLYIIFWPTSAEFRNAGIIFLGMDVSLFILSIISRFSISKELLGILADATFFIPFTIVLFRG
jgi:hypothetical protein